MRPSASPATRRWRPRWHLRRLPARAMRAEVRRVSRARSTTRVGDAEDDHRAGHHELDEHRLEADDEHRRSADERGHADHRQSRALGDGVRTRAGGGERRRERVREAADRRAEESDRDGSARLERDEPGGEQADAGRQGERRREVGAPQLRDHRPEAADDAEGERGHTRVDGGIHRARAEEVVRAHRPAVEPEQDDADRGDRLGRRPQREAPQHARPRSSWRASRRR